MNEDDDDDENRRAVNLDCRLWYRSSSFADSWKKVQEADNPKTSPEQ